MLPAWQHKWPEVLIAGGIRRWCGVLHAVATAYITLPGHLLPIHAGNDDIHHKPFQQKQAPFSLYMYVTLQFVLADLLASSRYEVYYQYSTERAASQAHEGKWSWLGSAFAPEYRVCELPVPSETSAVQFLVQPADIMGKLVPMSDAATTLLERP